MSAVSHVGINHPLRLSRWNEPEPDMTLLKLRPDERIPYPNEHPDASDTHVVIEVADLGVTFALGEKADLYARYGIPELWVLDLPGDRLVIHREPTADGYASVHELPRGESISPISFQDLSFTADELLGAPLAEGVSLDDLDDEAAGDQ